jgi:hypothetical protein
VKQWNTYTNYKVIGLPIGITNLEITMTSPVPSVGSTTLLHMLRGSSLENGFKFPASRTPKKVVIPHFVFAVHWNLAEMIDDG